MKKVTPKEVPITELAQDIVYGRGEKDYGHPRENMQTTAGLWNAFLIRRGVVSKDEPIMDRDVALMMALVKIARDAHVQSRDNLIDLAGYAAVADRLDTEE